MGLQGEKGDTGVLGPGDLKDQKAILVLQVQPGLRSTGPQGPQGAAGTQGPAGLNLLEVKSIR